MGQPVGVIETRVLSPRVLRIEVDRSLTGTAHEHYVATSEAITGPRPCDALAARLFDTGNVEAVHVLSNIVTVTLRVDIDPESVTHSVVRTVTDLFIHYRPGVQPTAV